MSMDHRRVITEAGQLIANSIANENNEGLGDAMRHAAHIIADRVSGEGADLATSINNLADAIERAGRRE